MVLCFSLVTGCDVSVAPLLETERVHDTRPLPPQPPTAPNPDLVSVSCTAPDRRLECEYRLSWVLSNTPNKVREFCHQAFRPSLGHLPGEHTYRDCDRYAEQCVAFTDQICRDQSR